MISPLVQLKRMDWIIITCAVLLSVIGIISIFSASFFRNDFGNFKKQIVFLILGLIFMFALSFLDWRAFRDQPHVLLATYFFSVISLVLLFFIAPETKGIKGWYKIGRLSLDPVPFSVLVLVLVLAKYFSARHVELYNTKHILISGSYAFIPFLLVFFQPDLGSALLLLSAWGGILLASGIGLKHFLLLCLVFSVLFTLSWLFLFKPYQKVRVLSFLFPDADPLEGGWSQRQSKIAIGSGGLYGKGFKKGTQVQLGFLTYPQTDFIFAAIAEEFGFVGVCIILSLTLILCLRIAKVSYTFPTNFPRLFALGISIWFMFQAFIHAGMNLGLLPVVGLPFPFVSYGGSGLITNFMALGILQSLKAHPDK